MERRITVDQVVRLTSALSPLEKLKVIELLTPDLAAALAPGAGTASAGQPEAADDRYQAGYERFPEDVGECDALIPYLALATERWV